MSHPAAASAAAAVGGGLQLVAAPPCGLDVPARSNKFDRIQNDDGYIAFKAPRGKKHKHWW